LLSILHPISVAHTVVVNGEIVKTYSLHRDNKDEKQFMDEWLCNISDDLTLINNNNDQSVKIIGFNSAKFDSQLIIKYLNIQSLIGSESNMKTINVRLGDREAQFIDIRNFIAGGTLDQFTRDFGNNNDQRQKGFFPYETITYNNYKIKLEETKPFEQVDFYSSLTNTNISDTDYQIYLTDCVKFENRRDYLMYYNELDTKIMVPAINKLISYFAEYNVDMLQYYSLSSAASAVKYALAYKEFDINADYTDTNIYHYNKPFIVTEYWWKWRVDGYNQQDKKKNRNITNNVKYEDYQYFRNKIENQEKCLICRGTFFYPHRKPSLDRIDNNLPHTKENVQITCAHCNVIKSDKDETIQKLKIQLNNYTIKYGLPMSIPRNFHEAYEIIRNGITGGLSIVHNRYNIKNETPIRKIV
jgi:hypothetical protein